MLSYLRLVSLFGLIAMVLCAGGMSWHFYHQSASQVKTQGEQINQAAAHSLLRDLVQTPLSAASARMAVDSLLEDLPLEWVRLYDASGILLYTTDGALPSRQFRANANAVKDGKPLTELSTSIQSPWFWMDDSQLAVVHSFIPLTVEGRTLYAELATDVSPSWHKLLGLQFLLVVSVVAGFLIVLATLYVGYLKAEFTIANLHERNMELEARAASAQEETRQKSQFLANISHELRTPLNAIIGFSDIIKNEIDQIKNPVFQGYIHDIHGSGVHLLSLINDILDFSKAEAGKLELEVEDVNATKLVANCIRLMEARAETAGVELINAMPREAFVLETDGKKFKQVLLNLLSNAVKFTPSGGRVKISGWQDMASDSFMFQVSDTGIGIAQKDIAKAMAPFGQVDNALSRKYDGTGLGLPLTKKFIELMGGKFKIQSELNVGTTITFNVPRHFKVQDGVVMKRLN